MAYPSLEQYNNAVQNPGKAFFDPELRAGQIKKSGLGLPLAMCGGFALTYNVACASGRYAVRCFHKQAGGLEDRYRAISSRLSSLKSSCFVDFDFQSRGVQVLGKPYPIVKMAWAPGETLGEFLEASFDNKERLKNLRASLRALAAFLEKNRLAHGDIQPGNLMIANEGREARLIDYDGMYLPEIAGMGCEELGIKNFQHPARSPSDWGEGLDRFSFILLLLVLEVLESRPELWKKTQSDGDSFLFTANDFAAPASSAIFADLLAIPGLAAKGAAFAAICQERVKALPSLEDFLSGAFRATAPQPLQQKLPGAPAPKAAARPYISSYPVLDALDYEACLAHVGDRVELVGRVVDVKKGRTKYGDPYCFLNFSDWRGNAVKISIWSEGLKGSGIRFGTLKGLYVSAIGLLEPPYKNSYYGYSHISITFDPATPFRVITQEEADYRLGRGAPAAPAGKAAGSGNRDVLARIRKKPAGLANIHCPNCQAELSIPDQGIVADACPYCSIKYRYSNEEGRFLPLSTASSNQDILKKIRSAGASGGTGGAPAPKGRPGARQASRPAPLNSPGPAPRAPSAPPVMQPRQKNEFLEGLKFFGQICLVLLAIIATFTAAGIIMGMIQISVQKIGDLALNFFHDLLY